MSCALKTVFDAHVMSQIMSFVPVDDFQIKTLFGSTTFSGAKHYVTYGGGPEGGFVYFLSRRRGKGGWYRWHRDWFKKAVYTKVVEGQVAFLIQAGGSEQIAILPDSWDTTVNLEALAETVIIADDCFMQGQLEEN